jgi:hypothetical protein
MNRDSIERNLEAFERHFHSEALNEVETALGLYTTTSYGMLPRSTASTAAFREKKR